MNEAHSEAAALVGCNARLIKAGEWSDCRLTEITPAGAKIQASTDLRVGERVVACIAEVGALTATVSAVVDGDCSLSFEARDARGASLDATACYARA